MAGFKASRTLQARFRRNLRASGWMHLHFEKSLLGVRWRAYAPGPSATAIAIAFSWNSRTRRLRAPRLGGLHRLTDGSSVTTKRRNTSSVVLVRGGLLIQANPWATSSTAASTLSVLDTRQTYAIRSHSPTAPIPLISAKA